MEEANNLEETNSLEDLKELIITIENQEKTEELISWMTEISAKEFGLVDSLIATFMDSLSNIQFANSVLRVLKILNQYVPELSLPQMRENSDFPKAITKYLSTTNLKDLEGDGFILLVEIFQASSFKEVITSEFINALFDSFSYLQSEAIYLAIIHILISVSFELSQEKNLVLKYSAEHANKRLFAEGVLILVNKGQSGIILKILQFICDILSYEPTKNDFFYTNDCRALVDILIREVGNTGIDDVRYMYLKALYQMLKTSYYQKEKHRSSDIVDLLNYSKYSDDISDNTLKLIDEMIESGLF